MTYQDFTTFTEVDVAADRIQKTANHVDHNCYSNETTYLYKDYGVDHFDDFTHKIKIKCVSVESGANAVVWMLANDLGDLNALKGAGKSAIDIHFNDVPGIALTEIHGTNLYHDAYTCSTDTWYYVKLVKSGTSLNAYIYSDTDYLNLLDTLTLTLHADHQFKYLYGCNTYNYGSSAHAVTDIENFDIYVNQITKTCTADARLKASITKTFACDSILEKQATKTFNCNSILSGKITGITRNSGGFVLGNCTVWLFKTSDKSFVEETTSNASGEYSFDGLLAGIDYFIRAFKDGSPNVFGTTDDNLEAS